MPNFSKTFEEIYKSPAWPKVKDFVYIVLNPNEAYNIRLLLGLYNSTVAGPKKYRSLTLEARQNITNSYVFRLQSDTGTNLDLTIERVVDRLNLLKDLDLSNNQNPTIPLWDLQNAINRLSLPVYDDEQEENQPVVTPQTKETKMKKLSNILTFFKESATEGAKDGAARVTTDAMVMVARKYYERYIPKAFRKFKFYTAAESLLVPTALFLAADLWRDKLPNADLIGQTALRSARTVFSDQSREVLGRVLLPMFKEISEDPLFKANS